ncbi:MAG TPA: NapC/NirT family cytochrome c [Steroidobacteraceae bacterium]|nr:NapC/NirT family cytochrome c [Steroidobacteraceae bacterium]
MSAPGGPQSPAGWLWRRPRRRYLLGIPLGGLIALILGIGIAGGFMAALKRTESVSFCTSCHEMQQPMQELTQSMHYLNVPGIRATCADCHVPPTFWAGLWRHIEASGEVWGHLTGKLDTPAKYESERRDLAEKIWRELKANDSAQCRRCHTLAAMALDKQDPIAAKRHSLKYLAQTHQTCIDCHKGVAHTLPPES